MSENDRIETEDPSFEGEEEVLHTSKLSGAALTAVLSVPAVMTAAYGGTDYWALGLQMVLATLLAAVWMSDSMAAGRFRLSRNPLQLPLLAMAGVGLVQLLPLRNHADVGLALPGGLASALSLDPFATRFAVMQLVAYIVFFAGALVFIDSIKRLRISVVFVLVFTSLMAFFGVLQFLAKPEAIYGLRPTPQAEPFSAFVNKHHFAALMVMTFALGLSLLIGRGFAKDKRFLLALVLVLSGIAVVLTGSRGGVLSLVTAVSLVGLSHLLLHRKHRDSEHDRETRGSIFSKTASMVVGGLVFVVLLVGAVIFLGGDSSLMRGVGLSAQEDLSSGRMHFWTVALQIFAANPVLGAGLDAFAVAFTRFDTWPGTFRVEQAHNDYLHVLAEAGVVGLLIVAGFIFLLFRRSLAGIARMTDLFPRSVAVGALAACAAVMVHSFFDFPLRTPANAYFFLLMAAFATISLKAKPRVHGRRRKPTLIDQY
jgi:O-antigen ligase